MTRVQAASNKSFGSDVGALKVNLEGVGLVGIGLVGIGPVGIGPEGIGPEGIGPEGIGPEGIELEGIEEDEIEGSGGVEDAEEAEDGCPGRVFASPGALGFTWPRVLVVLQVLAVAGVGWGTGLEEAEDGCPGRVFASPGALGFTWPRVLVVLQGVCAGAEEKPGGMAGRGCPVRGGTESSCGPSR